jgi:hypothetical protein
MDPDVVAQLEEQLRELTDMLSRQTSAMNAQMDAMNKVAGSAKSASDSMRNNSQTNTTATTKYAEAQEKATTQTGKTEIASKALAAGFRNTQCLSKLGYWSFRFIRKFIAECRTRHGKIW